MEAPRARRKGDAAAPGRADAERAILDLLAERDPGRTICPSDAARAPLSPRYLAAAAITARRT